MATDTVQHFVAYRASRSKVQHATLIKIIIPAAGMAEIEALERKLCQITQLERKVAHNIMWIW